MLSEEYIMKLCEQYAASPHGRTAIKEKYGIDYNPKDKGSVIAVYGEKMRRILFEVVNQVIPSFLLEDIIIGQPVRDKAGRVSLKISFRSDALFRESLDPVMYGGVDDIVLHFAYGWHAKGYVYGLWHRPGWNGGRLVQVRSRKDREPNRFLKHAVWEFNEQAKGVAVAELEAPYKDA